ncbi:hypothetical protein FEM33_22800 [Dyadobacter flavalbus]|uniref:Uncharacterized protein n=1 Tax=Dyadobacter flavalbus TaxID=2579942 RepID=A0A5M8QIB3_9BACT|nr:hypothetical protein [Dyadobacter flavalbus]KAA6434112.1 hypothetical protein FEM33_22800 [Dyadobacter flavalbus]
MENENPALEDYKDFGLTPESGKNAEQLAGMLRKKETEENLEKLARNLTAQWSKSKTASKKPDLSFAAFEKKLKEAGNQ